MSMGAPISGREVLVAGSLILARLAATSSPTLSGTWFAGGGTPHGQLRRTKAPGAISGSPGSTTMFSQDLPGWSRKRMRPTGILSAVLQKKAVAPNNEQVSRISLSGDAPRITTTHVAVAARIWSRILNPFASGSAMSRRTTSGDRRKNSSSPSSPETALATARNAGSAAAPLSSGGTHASAEALMINTRGSTDIGTLILSPVVSRRGRRSARGGRGGGRPKRDLWARAWICGAESLWRKGRWQRACPIPRPIAGSKAASKKF